MVPMPAPALASPAVMAEKEVAKSLPKAINATINVKNKAINAEMNPHMDCKIGSGKIWFPNLIGMTALG